MLDQIAVEKQLISEGKAGSGTLLSNLVRAPDQPQKPEEKRFDVSKAHKPLSTDEILGNIFVFNFAGHDTTSISLAYAVFLLVAHPGIQDWISEEINFYLGSEPDPTSWQHATTVPKLQRCLAVLVSSENLTPSLLPWKSIPFPSLPRKEDRLLWKLIPNPARDPPPIQPHPRCPQTYKPSPSTLNPLRQTNSQYPSQHPPNRQPRSPTHPSPLLGLRLPDLASLTLDHFLLLLHHHPAT